MGTAASWVAAAVETLSLSVRVRRLDGAERANVLRRVGDAFLERRDARFWWEHLKAPTASWATKHGYSRLAEIAPDPGRPCWLITGLEDSEDDIGIFECTPAIASALIGECPGFEYALVDPALRWIVIENHHDVLIAGGEAGVRLSRLRR
jgi:hypothetical protein